MKILKILMVLTLIFTMTGCSFLVLNSSKEVDNKGQEPVEEAEYGNESEDGLKEEPVEDNREQKDRVDENKAVEPIVDKTPDGDSEKKPEPAPKGKKLDFEALDKLDNTTYSWGLKLNNEHKTPGITSRAKELIEKYDGIFTGDTSKKVIYLTFDEGYENGYTPQILDTLKENDVKAIFFVTGSYVERNPELVKRMLDEGHEVGSHSITHPSLPEVDNVKLENELLGFEEKFYSEYGIGFEYLRPPKGEYSERTLEAARRLGYKSVFWSFTYRDWEVDNQKGADYAYNMVMNNLHNGAVILLHAVSKDNAEALDRIIKDIRAQGYTISPFNL